MIEIDFFGTSGARAIEERRQKVGTFIPNSEIRSDFMGFGYDYFDNADYGVGYGGYFYDGRYVSRSIRVGARTLHELARCAS